MKLVYILDILIQDLKQPEYDVYVSMVNDEETMRKLIDAGVSGTFTDFPQRLAVVLAEYKASRSDYKITTLYPHD